MGESNGNCVMKIGDMVYPLFFGRMAVEEFAKRTETTLSDNAFKLAADLIYAGFMNFQTRQNLPMSTYEEVYDLVEEFFDQEDAQKQFEDIDVCFFQSKYGSKYKERIEELKKKIEAETEILRQENLEVKNKAETKK